MGQFEDVKLLLGDSLNYYLIAVDMDSNYSFINKRYSMIFEPIHGILVGQNYSVTLHPDDQQVCKIVSQLAFAHPDKLFPATIRKHDGHGNYIITRWEYKAMFNEKMEPQGIFCIGHDITELIEVSSELENAKFFQSHHLRKPVANLIGLCKLIESGNLDKESRTMFKMIYDSVHELDKAMRAALSAE